MSALPANGKTYRLVTDSNGTVEASSVLLTAADAVDMLAAEVLIHRLAGWRVSVSGEGLEVAISAERGDSTRIVRVEEV